MIVVSWNRKELLQRCLYSLTCQTFQDFELIVVDNGSTDGAECYATIRNATNLGFARAANQGIAAATGEYVALLNNDAEADERWLEILVLVAEFDKKSNGMYASRIERPDGTIESRGCYVYPDGNGMCIRGRNPQPPDFPSGCAAMYRAEMLHQIGYFDERMWMYNEDTELGLRAKRQGWGCRYVNGAIVTHHGASRNNLRKLYHNERNRVLLMWSHFDFGQVFWSVPWTAWRFARMLWGR